MKFRKYTRKESVLLFMLGIALVWEYFNPAPDGVVYAQIIGTLVTGAGVQTVIAGQSQCDQYIMIGTEATAMPLQGLTVEVGGVARINIQGSQPLVSAFSKFMMQFSATVVGLLLKVSTGRIMQNTTYRFTNAAATTPSIFAFSDNSTLAKPVLATTVGINAQSFQDFTNFSALFITPSANAGNIEVTYQDGTKSTLSILEVDAYFNLTNQTEANGRLDAVVSCIDNRAGIYQMVRVNATTAVTVLIVKLTDPDFKELKAAQAL